MTAADVEALSLVARDVEAFHLRQAALGHDGSAPGAATAALVAGLLNRRLPGPGSAITATQWHYTGRFYAGDVLTVETWPSDNNRPRLLTDRSMHSFIS